MHQKPAVFERSHRAVDARMAPLGCLSLSVTQCVHPPARHRLIRAQRGNPRAPAWQRLSGFSRQLCWQRSRSAGILQAQKRAAMRPAALCKQDLQLMDSDVPGILIVDDNDDNRYTLQLLLEADGHTRLATAAGGQEALDLLAREKFSLVLLDMMMPDLNGDEVLRIIKGNPDTRDVSVVVLSADTDTERVCEVHRNRRRRLSAQAFQPDHSARQDLIRTAQALAAVARKRIPRTYRAGKEAFGSAVAEHPASGDCHAASRR